MTTNESFSDLEDLIPRNLPRPSTQNPNTATAQPSVPDVSIVFGPPAPKNIPYYNDYLERNQHGKLHKNNLPQNPLPPRTVVPELSLIFEPHNSPKTIAQFQLTPATKKIIQPEENKPSLPLKSFSSFKTEYGAIISSIENRTRKSVKFKQTTTSESSNSFSSHENDEEIVKNSEKIEPAIKDDCTNSNKIISDKLDTLTEMINSLFNEIKDVKCEVKDLKNIIEIIVDNQNSQVDCRNCSECSTKHDNSLQNSNNQQLQEIKTSKQFKDQFKNSSSPSVDKSKFQYSTPNFNNSPPRTNKEKKLKTPQKQFPITVITPRQQKLQTTTDLLQSLPESEPILIFNNNNETNRSLAMKKLAEKYLTNEQLNIYVNGKNYTENFDEIVQIDKYKNKNSIDNAEKKCTDMSMATFDYMKKYKLIKNDDNDEVKNFINHFDNQLISVDKENILFFNNIKKGPKLI